MKQLNTYITEYIIKKKLDKPIDSENHFEYHPKTKQELFDNINELVENNIYDFNCIDTSEITDMSDLFYDSKFEETNIDVSEWDVSNVKNMKGMFKDCENFDCDVSNWNVSNVKYMQFMFDNCTDFEGKGLEKWSLDNAEYMSNMFEYCENFDCDVSNWKMSKAETIEYMFSYCVNFTGKGLNKWKLTPETKINKALDHCNINKLPSWYKT